MLVPTALGVPYVSETELKIAEDELGRGADADVYRGEWCVNGRASYIQVAVKRARIRVFGEATKLLVEKKRFRLIRELLIWSRLQNTSVHPHILPLLGIIEAPNGLLESVSEYCVGTLASYLQGYGNRPRRIDLVVGTLNGLTHMHELSVVHGDLKSVNVLVTEHGTPKICDFGHSRLIGNGHQGQFSNSDASSSFQATLRYTCPEYFHTNKAKPTVFSDMWAFGCLALEILSHLQPYHTIESEFLVSIAIKSGVVPSVKPEYPNAAGCLNEVLWSVVKRCWYTNPTQRPTSSALLESISGLVERGLVNPAAATPGRPTLQMDEDLVPLPDGISNYANKSIELSRQLISSHRIVKVWAYCDNQAERNISSNDNLPLYAVKVPYVADGRDFAYTAHRLFENALRQLTRDRYGWQHKNIVRLLGIDTSFGSHYGLVMEYCSQGDFKSYKNRMRQEEDLYITYMSQILNGLQYLHTMISPLSHGDLTPKNILVDGDGNLRLTSFSFRRLLLDLPGDVRRVLLEDSTLSARHISPELLQDAARPTPASDMWAFGNVAVWIFTSLDPYPDRKEEIDVVAQLSKGTPPNGLEQLGRLEQLGGTRLLGDPNWLSNGIWTSILRCWNVDPEHRLTVADFLKVLENLPMSVIGSSRHPHWKIDGVTDLTGRIKKHKTHRYGVGLGWSVGKWRGAYDGRGNRVAYVTLMSWKSELSQGFFWSSIEVTLKNVEPGPRTSIRHAARQSMKHEILLLKEIRHPSICALLGIDHTSVDFTGVPSIVLEHCSNRTIQEYYAHSFVDLGRKDKIDLLKDLGSALHYLHHELTQGVIVHGNLSLDTILIDSQRTLKLSNFEFACHYAHFDNALEATVIQAPPLAPSPSKWHAPDFFEGPKDTGWPNPTQFTDLWALGCMTVAIWVNKLPYAGFETPSALSHIINGHYPFSQTDCMPEIWDISTRLWRRPFYDRITTKKFLTLIEVL